MKDKIEPSKKQDHFEDDETPQNIEINNDIISFNGDGEIKESENAVPPKAWKNQQKAYSDAWENNRNQQLEDEL